MLMVFCAVIMLVLDDFSLLVIAFFQVVVVM